VSGKKISLEEICKYVLKISGKDLPVYICKEGLANEYTASNARFLNECKDFRHTPMEKAIEELYQWYSRREEQIEMYKLLY